MIVDRFWIKVKKTPTCWLWLGAKTNGYGRININGRSHIASRIAFFLEHKKLPKFNACHTCDNRMCVRPEHIFDGTYKQNIHDGISKGRIRPGYYNKIKNYCKKGHEFSELNTYCYMNKLGNTCRGCKICRRDARRKCDRNRSGF